MPETEEVLAPVDGTLTQLFPTGHAAGITTAEGIEILIHVGIDTVALRGKEFTLLTEQGQKVRAGTPLIRLDLVRLRATAKSLATPIIVTNMKEVQSLQKTALTEVHAGEDWLMKVLRKIP